MKRTSVELVTNFILLFASTHAMALSGTELYQSCAGKKLGMGDIACIAYVHGFVDGMLVGKTVPMRSVAHGH
jgi:hypothetical protein